MRTVTSDNWEICVCIIRPAGRSRLSLVLSSFMSMCACPICSREKKNSWTRNRRMNELLLLAPLYLEGNNLRIFEPFSFTFVRARFLFNTRKDQKRKKEKLSRFFPFFLGTGEWHSIETGCWLAGLSVSIVICSSSLYDRYMASTTLYNSSLLLYVVWLFFLSPSFNFSPPPVSFRPKNGPHSLPDTFFYSKRWLCSLTIKEVPVLHFLMKQFIAVQYIGPGIIQTHTHRNVCNALNRKRGC